MILTRVTLFAKMLATKKLLKWNSIALAIQTVETGALVRPRMNLEIHTVQLALSLTLNVSRVMLTFRRFSYSKN